MDDPVTRERLERLIQFQHPEKALGRLPGWAEAMTSTTLATLFGTDTDTFDAIRREIGRRTQEAAEALLADPDFAERVDRIPFAPGSTVVGVGDSITDDYQSWLEILRHLLILRRADDDIRIVNAGFSGDTTTHAIPRFIDVVNQQPDWILCMLGTNDVRTHGISPTKTLVSLDETERNLMMLLTFARTQTTAEWVWLTPARVVEAQITSDQYLAEYQVRWRNDDLAAVAEVVRRQAEPVVDLQAVFDQFNVSDLLLADGLHPNLDGQKLIVTAVVERLSQLTLD